MDPFLIGIVIVVEKISCNCPVPTPMHEQKRFHLHAPNRNRFHPFMKLANTMAREIK